MKNIHPQYYPDAQVTCACGNTFTVGSTKSEIKVDVCSACHPLFTGKMRYVGSGGRVKKFRAHQQAAQSYRQTKTKGKKGHSPLTSSPQSLKEMLKKAVRS